jgi:hypothetical protein
VVGTQKEISPNKVRILIKVMYINVVTCVRACDGESDTFSIKIGLHQGSALGPYIFHLSDGRDHKRHTRRYFLVYTLC